MKKYYVLFFLVFFSYPAFAYTYDYAKDGFRPLRPIEVVEDLKEKKVNNVKQLSIIRKLEQKVFGKSFANNDIEDRVSALEEQVLGSIFGGDINSRLQTLQRVIPGYLRSRRVANSYSDSYYDTPVYSATSYNPHYYSTPVMTSSGGWRGLAGSLGNFFFGVPTGMSPQIHSPFVSDFAPDYQNGLYTNRGWRLNNMHTGSGVGIKMLP